MEGIEQAFTVIFSVILIFYAVSVAARLAGHVLKALALTQMLRNAGFREPFLAWVPVANNFLLGNLCDRAVCFQKGKSRGFAVLLPLWDVLGFVFGQNLFAFLSYYDGLNTRFAAGETFFTYHKGDPMDLLRTFLAVAILASFGCALWHLYRDYAPERAVLFTVLSVVFGPLAQAILLFTIRNRVPVSARGGAGLPPETYTSVPFPTAPTVPPPGSQPPAQPDPPESREESYEDSAGNWYQPGKTYQRPFRTGSPKQSRDQNGPEL